MLIQGKQVQMLEICDIVKQGSFKREQQKRFGICFAHRS